MALKPVRPERLIIRPPSEWRSMLVRVTRGCKWNRCKFCGQYPAFGEPAFSVRDVDDVKDDIDWFAARMPFLTTAFLGDADPLCRPLKESLDIISYLRIKNPRLERVTAYARAQTMWKLGEPGLKQLARAGLNRLHIGLESGDLQTLKFQFKGQTPKIVVQAGQWIKNAGIELSLYVLLGIAGQYRWKEHCDETANALNIVNPDFIRMRRLWVYQGGEGAMMLENPLCHEVKNGNFTPQTAEGTVKELRRILSRLENITGSMVCDHANNYVTVEGRMPDDKEKMLAAIDEFLSLPEHDRNAHYEAVGSTI
ncbi:MAG: radical SAM protein [Chitinivibrionales bacterium]|nr:radical SAM protein [Chitinivibrionales bacterium]